MDTSTSSHTGRVQVKNHMSRQLLDWQHTMHNVKITPVNSGYQLKFSQFSSDVYPDTSCTETIIATSMTKRKKLSMFPIKRQLQCREGRQWKITGLTTFDVEYRGQTARVEALVSPTLEDRIFLGWADLHCKNKASTNPGGLLPNSSVQKSKERQHTRSGSRP